MKIYKLTTSQQINKPLQEVFAFFENPENLEKITPKSLGFEFLTPTPIEMKEGAVIDYRIKISGLPMRWTSLIKKYDPPNMFIDEQTRGPYALWHHKHLFEENTSGTLVKDEVDYAVPYGLLGRLAHFLFVKRQLNKIFSYRKKIIEDYFRGEK